MGLLQRITGALRGREQRSAPSSWTLMQTGDAGAGTPVSPVLAENLASVFAAVQAISETVGTLPVRVLRTVGDGQTEEVLDHPVVRLLTREPNRWQTPVEFMELLTAHCLLRGNSYAEIVRDDRGAPTELVPLHPDMVAVRLLPGTLRVVYDITDPMGRSRRLLPEEILHLKDRSDDGVVGKSRLQRARETFTTAIATERYASNIYANGASMTGVLKHPEELGPEAAARLRESFERLYQGSANAGRVAVLEEGTEWQQLSVSPEDAQMLDSRRFSVEQVARLFRVPPPMLGDLTNSNYSNVTELGRQFATHTVKPWVRRIEATFERALLSEEGRRTHRIELDMDDLLRGDMLTRFRAYRIAREIGLANANELRRWEGMDPRTDERADNYFEPQNMNAEQATEPDS
jgi:HK97 family phage portal protein